MTRKLAEAHELYDDDDDDVELDDECDCDDPDARAEVVDGDLRCTSCGGLV